MGCVCAEDRRSSPLPQETKKKIAAPAPPASQNPFLNKKLLRPGVISRSGSFSNSSSIATPRPSTTVKPKKKRAALKLELSVAVKKLSQPLSSYITLKNELWSDATETVSSARYKKTKVACVVFTRNKPKNYRPEDSFKFLESVHLLRSLDYPQVLRIKEILEDKAAFFIVTEEFPYMRLSEYLKKNGVMEDRLAAQIVAQVLATVQYCHSRTFILRTLSTASLLVSRVSS